MDFKWLYQEFVMVVFLIHIRNCLTLGFLDDDDDQTWGRCPWIRNKLKNGRVKMRSRGRIAKFLCDPGYELVGKRFATCVRGQWNNPIPFCVARGCPKLPEPSNGRVTEMYRGAYLVYDCAPGYALDGDISVYCDGRRWSSSPPECEPTTSEPMMTCDFESPDLCGWNHDPTHDFDWKRNQFSTPSGHVGTGPSFDHTYGEGKGGFYLYEEASSPRKVNDTARLFSPVYPSDYSGGCFVFYYHMYGATTGGLRIYVKSESSVFSELAPSWKEFGDQGNQWLRGNVSVPPLSESFQIVIEGIRGISYVGDTAIDDVSLSTSDCESAENNTDRIYEYSLDSCRGRCREPDYPEGCGCNDNCFPSNCCNDYTTICTAGNTSFTENPEEIPIGEDLATTALPLTVIITAAPSIKTSTDFPGNVSNHVTMLDILTSTTTPVSNDTEASIKVSNYGTTHSISVSTNASETSSISTAETTVSTNNMSTDSSTVGMSLTYQSNFSSVALSTNTTSSTTVGISTSSTLIDISTSYVKLSTNADLPNNIPINTHELHNISSRLPSLTSMAPTLSESNEHTATNISTIRLEPTFPMQNESTPIPVFVSTQSPSSLSQKSSFKSDDFVTNMTSNLSSISTFTSELVSTSTEIVNNPTYSTEQTRKTYNLRPRTQRSTVGSTPKSTERTKMSYTKFTTRMNESTEYSSNLSSSTRTSIDVTKYSPSVTSQKTDRMSYVYTPTHNYARFLTVNLPKTYKTTSNYRNSFSSTTTKMPLPTSSVYTSTLIDIPSTPLSDFFTALVSTTTQHKKELPTENTATKSKATASNNGQSTIAIVSIAIIAIVTICGGIIYFMRRQQSKRQSKLSDDSEMRFLSENEIIDYSDASLLDKILVN